MSIAIELTWTDDPGLLLLELILLNVLRWDHHGRNLKLIWLILHVKVLLLEHFGHIPLDSLLLLHLHLLLLDLSLMLILHYRLVQHRLLSLRLVTSILICCLHDVQIDGHLLLLKRHLLAFGGVLWSWVLHASALSLLSSNHVRMLLDLTLNLWLVHRGLCLEWAWNILWTFVLLLSIILAHLSTWSLESRPLVIVVLWPVTILMLTVVSYLLLYRLRLEESVRGGNTSCVV